MGRKKTTKTLDDLLWDAKVRNADVCQETGITPQDVSQIRQGRRLVRERSNKGRMTELMRLAEFLDLPPEIVLKASHASVDKWNDQH